MEPEWVDWLRENMPPDWYEQMKNATSWATEWRDKLITDRTSERDRLREAALAAINGAGKHNRGWIITDAAMHALRSGVLQEADK